MIQLLLLLSLSRGVLSEGSQNETSDFSEELGDESSQPWAVMGETLTMESIKKWPERPLLGGEMMLSCSFQDLNSLDSDEASSQALSYRLKWSRSSPEGDTTILVAMRGRVLVNAAYQSRVQLPGYPQNPTDFDITIMRVRASDSGRYKCEVQHELRDTSAFVDVEVEGVVFSYHLPVDNKLTYEEAINVCKLNSAVMASAEQVEAAHADGFHQCDTSWIDDGSVWTSIRDDQEKCDSDKQLLPGVKSHGQRHPKEKHDVVCFAEKMTGSVFFTTSVEKYSFEEASRACDQQNAQLATVGQMHLAWRAKLDVCKAGWMAYGEVGYPINVPSPECGEGGPGVKMVEGPIQSKYGAFCYQELPKVQQEDDLETPKSPLFSLFTFLSIIMDVAGGFAGHAEAPTSKPPGFVFLHRSEDGYGSFTYNEAVEACQTAGATIASMLQLQEAKPHTCVEGWIEGNRLGKLHLTHQDMCGHPHEVEPSVHLNPVVYDDTMSDVYCYSDGLRGRFFDVESAEGFTYSEAVSACREQKASLAKVADLYAAWKNGYGKCEAGWLLDGSVRYAVTSDQTDCGRRIPDVHTVYTDFGRGYPDREQKYNAYCVEGATVDEMTPDQSTSPASIQTASTSAVLIDDGSSSRTAVCLFTTEDTLSTSEVTSETPPKNSAAPTGDNSSPSTAGVKCFLIPQPPEVASSTSEVSTDPANNSSELPVSEQPSPVTEITMSPLLTLEGVSIDPEITEDPETSQWETPSPRPQTTEGEETSSRETRSVLTSLWTTEGQETTQRQTRSVYTDPETTEDQEMTTRERRSVPTSPWTSKGRKTTSRQSRTISTEAENQKEATTLQTRPTPSRLVSADGDQATARQTRSIPTDPEPTDDEQTTVRQTRSIPTDPEPTDDERTTVRQTRTPLCSPNPCADSQPCSVENGKAVCGCKSHYRLEMGVCGSNPCRNGGTCRKTGKEFKCKCLQSYNGKFCEIDTFNCTKGWSKFEGNCYKLMTDQKTWMKAEQECIDHAGHLVSIFTENEHLFVAMDMHSPTQWIGLSDRMVEGHFKWTEGLFLNMGSGEEWAKNIKSENNQDKDCVQMIKGDAGEYSMANCNAKLPFTCKKSPISCGNPPKVENARVHTTRLVYPVYSFVQYTCDFGFRHQTTPFVKCMATGEWETPTVECVAVTSRKAGRRHR